MKQAANEFTGFEEMHGFLKDISSASTNY